MIRFLTAALMSCIAGLALAADLDGSFAEIGRMSAEVDGVTHALVLVRDAEGRATAEQKTIIGQLTINLLGQTVGKDGMPGSPMVQVTLQGQPGAMRLISAEVFDEQGYDAPLAMVPGGGEGGDGALAEFALEGEVTTGRVEGAFLRLAGYLSEPRVADGAEPLPAKITWEVTLPPMD